MLVVGEGLSASQREGWRPNRERERSENRRTKTVEAQSNAVLFTVRCCRRWLTPLGGAFERRECRPSTAVTEKCIIDGAVEYFKLSRQCAVVLILARGGRFSFFPPGCGTGLMPHAGG